MSCGSTSLGARLLISEAAHKPRATEVIRSFSGKRLGECTVNCKRDHPKRDAPRLIALTHSPFRSRWAVCHTTLCSCRGIPYMIVIAKQSCLFATCCRIIWFLALKCVRTVPCRRACFLPTASRRQYVVGLRWLVCRRRSRPAAGRQRGSSQSALRAWVSGRTAP